MSYSCVPVRGDHTALGANPLGQPPRYMKPAFLPLGPRQLPRVHAQCHSPATEPGHDTYHPQTLLWGYTTGEQGEQGDMAVS